MRDQRSLVPAHPHGDSLDVFHEQRYEGSALPAKSGREHRIDGLRRADIKPLNVGYYLITDLFLSSLEIHSPYKGQIDRASG